MQEQFAGFTYNPANEHMGESYTGTSAVGSAGASHHQGSAW